MTRLSQSRTAETSATRLAATGIDGLDNILGGGFPRNHLFLVQGAPGTGKTTLGLHFLMEGIKRGERGMYITLSETAEELRIVAMSHGWSVDDIRLHELISVTEGLRPETQYTVFDSSEIELGETIRAVIEEVEEFRPHRLVFDSLSELRLLAQNSLKYRRQILAIKQLLKDKSSTVLLLDRTGQGTDDHGESIAHGVVTLEVLPVDYGADRRRIRVAKLRGVNFRAGYHDYTIVTGGLKVFPRLVALEHQQAYPPSLVTSGIPELDQLLGGGITRGTSSLILGPAGTGKSTLVTQFAHAAAKRNEKVALYIFEESLETYKNRAKNLGIPINGDEFKALIDIKPIDPAELSPGEFVVRVTEAVRDHDVRLVIIDSLNGFLNAMAGEQQLVLQLHELLSYLRQKGVTTLLTESQHGLMGADMGSPVDVSYLADTVMLLRYFEAFGEVRQAISVIKNRASIHERTVREFRLGPGIRIGNPLKDFHGVLRGVPTYTGDEPRLLRQTDGLYK